MPITIQSPNFPIGVPGPNEFTDELLNTSAIVIGSWVKITNNASGNAYISSAATNGVGQFTIAAPAGTYTVYTGPTNVGPWTATGNANYRVANTVPIFNVLDYGAKGDGAADDTVAIVAAMTDAAVNGGTVILPIGTYKVTSTITIPKNVSIEGQGWTSILQSSVASPIIQIAPTNVEAGETHGVHYSHFRIDGVSTANALTGALIVLWAASPSRTVRTGVIDGVQFSRCGTGLHLVNTQGMTVRDCKFGGYTANDGFGNTLGVYLSDNAQIGGFQNCDFRSNVTGMKMEASQVIIGGVADRIYAWHLDTCHFESNSGQALILDGATYNTFSNCKFEQNAGTYITIQQTVSGYRCDGNEFIGCTFNGNGAVPTVLYLDIQSANQTVFQATTFNSGSNGGVNISGSGWNTVFLYSNVNCTVTDLSSGTVGTVWNTYFGRVALARSVFTLTDAATVLVDASRGDIQSLTLTAGVGNSRTMGTPTSTRNGQQITFLFTNDSTAGRTISWNSIYKVNWIPSTVANAINTITFVYDGTNWKQISYVAGPV